MVYKRENNKLNIQNKKIILNRMEYFLKYCTECRNMNLFLKTIKILTVDTILIL